MDSVVEHRDPGVPVHGFLKVLKYSVVKKAFNTLGFIGMGIEN